MPNVDINRIINGTPEKELINAYEDMKQNFNDNSARNYAKMYIDRTLPFILKNSYYIFSEPLYGIKFYLKVLSSIPCLFTLLKDESEKFNAYLNENYDKMSDIQKQEYDKVRDFISNKLNEIPNSLVCANYINNNISKTIGMDICSLIYDFIKLKKDKFICNLELAKSNPFVYFLYAPYVNKVTNDPSCLSDYKSFIDNYVITDDLDKDRWINHIDLCNFMHKLYEDKSYTNLLNDIHNKDYLFFSNKFANESVSDLVHERVEIPVKESAYIYNSPELAINSLFDDIESSEYDKESNANTYYENKEYEAIALESTLDLLKTEYESTDDLNSTAVGYSFVGNESTIEEAYNKLLNIYNENPCAITEADTDAEADDVSDDDINNMDKDINSGDNDTNKGETPSASQPQQAGIRNSSGVLQKPKPKNFATKIQNKFMNKEAKQYQKRAQRRQNREERQNAFKAVAKLPANFMKDIKNEVHKLDEADDDRRKSFMTEPGYRKKIFRNLRLAVLYGGAAATKLSLVPVVATCRHFSKQKDRRIRNELVREIQTDINVCEEKINDAQANEDKQEKYRLIRLRDQLKAELARVRLNSRYV